MTTCTNSANEPIGTNSAAALDCNARAIDQFTNSNNDSFVNRVGKTSRTLQGIQTAYDNLAISFGWNVVGDFASTPEVGSANDVLSSKSITGNEDALWRTNQPLPYTPTGTDPTAAPELGKWIAVAQGTLGAIARSLNVVDSAVIYSIDTTTVLDGVLYIYDPTAQAVWSKPESVLDGEFISSVIGNQLTTDTLNTYTLTAPTVININSVQDMILHPVFSLSQRITTGATTWMVNPSVGVPISGGLFAKPLNGLWLNDWAVDETGVVNCDDSMEQMLSMAGLIGAKCQSNGVGSVYLITRQQTIRHDTSMNFNGATVNFVQSTTNNDSPFQMGNNTELKGISRFTYNSSSTSAFTTLGLVKIGEFYAEISGSPSAGENSLDSTYWEVENVTIENVSGTANQIGLYTDRGYSATVFIAGGTKITTKNIHNSGLAADGEKVTLMSTVITETGYDINERRQGFDLNIISTTGEDLRAHPENGVVYINGDRNTRVQNVYGNRCGQIYACNTSGNSANQSPLLEHKNGINSSADNIIGEQCEIVTGDTFTKIVAGVNLKGDAPEDGSENQFVARVTNVYIEGTAVTTDMLEYAIALGDVLGNDIDNSRMHVDGFNVSLCNKGLLIDSTCKGVIVENGRAHSNQTNGCDFRGNGNILRNVKLDSNNQAGETNASSFNAHGMAYSATNGLLDSCKFGSTDLTEGSETQLRSISVTGSNSTGVAKNCQFNNYQAGQADIQIRTGVVNSFIDIQSDCRGVRNLSTNYPIAPGVALSECNTNANGSTNYQFGCTVIRVSAGRYRVTFDKTLPDAGYAVLATAVGGTGADVTTDYSSASTISFDVYTKVGGVETDASFSAIVHGNNPTTF